MKILIVHNKYRHYGGEDAVVQNESSLLKKGKIEVLELFFENEKIDPSALFFNKEAFKVMEATLENFEPDVVHVHNLFYKASPSILKAAKIRNIPVVMTLHNYRLLCPGALFLRGGNICTKCKNLIIPIHGIRYKCFKESYSKSLLLASFLGYCKLVGTWKKYVDKFVVLTPFIKTIFEDSSIKFRKDQIVVKPNSTDDLLFLGENHPVRKGYLFVGRLSVEKGVDFLVDSFNAMPDSELHIIGEGDLESQLIERAGKNITFHGKQPREFIMNRLQRSKALIFPSIWYEGLPNTIIEAYSSGTPVIASDIDNINNLVTDGHNGLLFNPSDCESFIAVMNNFEKIDFTEISKNARKTYLINYTHKSNFDNLIELYSSMIK